MGKRTLNPMEDFRRQKRKKEVAKNKTSRISARDERVKETKTIQEVEQAIRDMERRGTKTPAEQQKLQRLQKELKLVKDEANKPTNKEVVAATSAQPQRLTELDDPRKSVYYDETLNPYGAPPPGKPRMYHRRGGGETMDIREAVVPGQEELLTSVDLPNPTEVQQRKSQNSQTKQTHHPSRLPKNELISNPQRPHQIQKMPPPPPPPLPPPPPPPPRELPPVVPPPLPEPSLAVQRIKRKKTGILADIWASTEEVSYERTVKCNDLEDANNNSIGWWYRDTSHNVQGPFGTEQILDWSRAGYFPPDTPVRQGEKGKWWVLADVDWTTGERKVVVKNKQGGAVEDRIAALRKHPTIARHDGNPACAEDLREQVLTTANNHDDDDDNESGDDDTSVAARIEALKQSISTRGDVDGGVSERSHDLEQGHSPSTEVNDDDDDEIAARIAALRKPLVNDNQSSVDTHIHALGGMTNPVDTLNSVMNVECFKRAGESHNEIMPFAYPMLETDKPPVYPIDDNMLYPSGADLAYPIYDERLDLHGDIPYPMDSYPMDASYPVTGAYAEESSKDYPDSAYDTTADDKAKTTLLVVPGLIPTHLQKSRKSRSAAKVMVAKPKLPQEKPTKENSKALADDYDNFMEEIASLK